jgi:DNA end-binding protein Ku
MARPVWEGDLRLSLVTCPVALFNATTSAHDVSFHLLHKKTHKRINMVPHEAKLGAVDRKDLVKGYEFEPGKYVILTKDEIAAVRLPSNRAIDIEQFVDAADIDHIYWDNPYYLSPRGKTPSPAYQVIRAAMEESKKVAIGRVVMHNRERLVALEPRGKGIIATTLRSYDEVRDEEDFFQNVPSQKIDRKMLDIAEKIIDQQAGAFDPSQFNDRYEEALRDLIKRKQKGKIVTEDAPPPKDEKIIDLMDALKRSLAGDKKGHGERVLKTQSRTKTKAAPKRRGHAA